MPPFSPDPHFAHRLLALLALVVATVVVAPAVALGASYGPGSAPFQAHDALAGSAFQGGDGDQEPRPADATDPEYPQGLLDWKDVIPTAATTTADFTGNADPGYAASDNTISGKEDEPAAWEIIPNGQAGNKFGLLGAWAYTANSPSPLTSPNGKHTFLSLAFVRETPNGNTYLTFELNQDTRLWDGDGNAATADVPCRTTGDILISYEVEPGGTTAPDPVTVRLYRWTNAVSAANGCARTGTVDAGQILNTEQLGNSNPRGQGAVNHHTIDTHFKVDTSVPRDGTPDTHPDVTGDGVPDTTIETGKFGEATIDLSAILESLSVSCFSFGQLQMHSRSSSELNSAVKDYVEPFPIPVRTCAAQGTKFNDANANGTREPGENGLAGWEIWADFDGDGHRDVTEDTNADGDRDPGEADVDNDGRLDVSEPFSAPTTSSGAYVVSNIRPVTYSAAGLPTAGGTYTLRERPVAGQTGYLCSRPTDATAPDGDDDLATASTGPRATALSCGYGPIDPSAEPEATRHFGNYRPGTVVIDKVVTSAAAADQSSPSFAFTTNGLGAGFSLAGDSTAHRITGVAPNTSGTAYTVTETAQAGFDLVDVDCDDGDSTQDNGGASATATIRVNADETVTCTFTNRARGTASGFKYEDLDGDGSQDANEPGLAGFTIYADLDGQGDHDPAEPSAVSSATGAWSISGLVPGTVTLREDLTAAQVAAGWACTEPSNATCSLSATIAAGDTTGSLRFGNWIAPRAKVAKVTAPAGDATTSFGFASQLPGNGTFTLKHGESTGFVTMTAGAHTAEETDPTSDYDLTDVTCAGTDAGAASSASGDTATFRLQSRDEVTCTFTNTKKGAISGVKYHDLDGDGTQDAGEDGLAGFRIYVDANTDGTFDAGEPSDVSSATGTWSIPGISAGTGHKVREDLTAAQQADGWACTDPGTPCELTVDVAAGATAGANKFGNWIPPQVKVAKVTDPAGDAATGFGFASQIPGRATFTLKHGESTGFETVAAGTYTATETDPTAGYDLTDITCSGTDGGPASSDAGATATFRVQSADRVTCTFTNTKKGSISGVKYHDLNGDGDQDAGEDGLPGFRIYLDRDKQGDLDAGEPSVVSDASGAWSITGVSAGANHEVREALTAAQQTDGWTCTDPGASCRLTVDVGPGAAVTGRKFGNWIPPQVRVAKVTSPAGDATSEFGFASQIPGKAAFTLKHGESTGFVTVAAGTHTATETNPTSGYDLTGIACAGTDTGTASSHSGATATFDVQSGDKVTCTFTNTRKGTISGVKYHDLDGDGDRDAGEDGLAGFRIYLDADKDGTRDAGEASDVSSATGTWSISGISAGSGYEIREDLTQAQKDAGWVCTDPGAGCKLTVDVAPGAATGGERFGNWIPPQVRVAKITAPAGDAATDFGFTSQIPGRAAFTLKDGASSGFITVAAGTYTATEADPTANYELTDVACAGTDTGTQSSDAGATATFAVQSGDMVTCTFTNTRKGTIAGVKYHDLNGDGDQDAGEDGLAGFRIYVDTDKDGTRDAGEASDVSSASGAWSIGGVSAGPGHEVREDLTQTQRDAGWVCTDPGTGCKLTVDLAPGATAGDKRFGNWIPPQVKVAKVTLPAGDATTAFAFTSQVPGKAAFDLKDGEDTGFLTTPAGAFDITEDDGAEYLLTGIACTGTDTGTQSSTTATTATVDLQSGDKVTCVFTNTKLATIEIEKQTVVQEAVGADFGFTAGQSLVDESDLTAAGFALKDDGVERILHVLPNAAGAAYTVTEDAKPGYRLTDVTCNGDADSTTDKAARRASIHVSPGETTRCTFTNLKLTPSQLVIKEGTVQAHHGDDVTYTFAVTNTGNSPLQNVVVKDDRCAPMSAAPTQKLNDTGDGFLDPVGADGTAKETWIFSCTTRIGPHVAGEEDPIHNTATVTADDEQGAPVPPATDDHLTHILHPDVEVDKKVRIKNTGDFVDGPIPTYVGDSLEYRFQVTNQGDTPLTVTKVDDPKCDAGTFSGPDKTGNGDGLLDVGEVWTYTCTHVVTSTDADPIHNVVTVTGVDVLGGPAGTDVDSDEVDADILHPAIDIEKTGPATAEAGKRVPYQLAITNPGDVAIVGETLSVTDPKCDAPPVLIGKGRGDGADPSPATLDPGDTWVYGCFAPTQTGQQSLLNTARADGFDVNGRPVGDVDDVTTTLTQPQIQVLPEAIVSGAARLRGPTACASRSFVARVAGRRIKTVTWKIDGKIVKRFTSRTGEASKAAFRVNPRRYGKGVHRLSARITFNAKSRTGARTLRMTFQACASRIIAPTFTG